MLNNWGYFLLRFDQKMSCKITFPSFFGCAHQREIQHLTPRYVFSAKQYLGILIYITDSLGGILYLSCSNLVWSFQPYYIYCTQCSIKLFSKQSSQKEKVVNWFLMSNMISLFRNMLPFIKNGAINVINQAEWHSPKTIWLYFR